MKRDNSAIQRGTPPQQSPQRNRMNGSSVVSSNGRTLFHSVVSNNGSRGSNTEQSNNNTATSRAPNPNPTPPNSTPPSYSSNWRPRSTRSLSAWQKLLLAASLPFAVPIGQQGRTTTNPVRRANFPRTLRSGVSQGIMRARSSRGGTVKFPRTLRSGVSPGIRTTTHPVRRAKFPRTLRSGVSPGITGGTANFARSTNGAYEVLFPVANARATSYENAKSVKQRTANAEALELQKYLNEQNKEERNRAKSHENAKLLKQRTANAEALERKKRHDYYMNKMNKQLQNDGNTKC